MKSRAQVFPRTAGIAAQLQKAAVAVRDAESQREDVRTVAKFYTIALGVEMRKPARCVHPTPLLP